MAPASQNHLSASALFSAFAKGACKAGLCLQRYVREPWEGLLHFAAVGAILSAASVALAEQSPNGNEVRIIPSPLGSGSEETTYEARSGSCRVRWTVARSGVNQSIAQHRAECTLPLSEQMSLNSNILDKVLEAEPTFRTLFLGRLTPFPDLSVRLATAAKRSPTWNARLGRPKASKPVTKYLMDELISSESTVFAEWKLLFESKGLGFAVSGVENVSVGAAGSLPYFPQLKANGLVASDRVPFNCLIWFSAERQK